MTKRDNIKTVDKSSKSTKKAANRGQTKNMHNREIGEKGEKAAIRYLENKGYDILCTNWKCKMGEMDIVAMDAGTLVFVEVKTRTNISIGLPEDAVGAKKRKKYECMAAMYLQDHDYCDMGVRFDVIGILVINGKRALIRHHSNAFGCA